jgi:hypothetical protein
MMHGGNLKLRYNFISRYYFVSVSEYTVYQFCSINVLISDWHSINVVSYAEAQKTVDGKLDATIYSATFIVSESVLKGFMVSQKLPCNVTGEIILKKT